MKNMLNLRILKRPVGRPGGWLWVLVLLALPRCAGLIGVDDWSPARASTTAVFCDIPKPPPPDGPQCASLDEVAFSAIRLAAAAVALNTGQLGSNIALDDSPAALAACASPPFRGAQRIERGDAYVEFSATAIGNAVLSHVAGLSEIPKNCPDPCTDVNQSPNDITFGISLNVDGRVYVIEKGVLVTGPDLNGSFGLYNEQNQHERFRVSLRQSSDA